MRVYEQLIRRVAWGALVVDAAGQVTAADAAAAKMLELSQAGLVGQSAKQFLPAALLDLSHSFLQCETAVRNAERKF